MMRGRDDNIILFIIMGKKKVEAKQSLIKPPTKLKFYLGSRERYITIRSDFDSGNIGLIRQISEFQYRLTSIHDGTYTDHPVNCKSWFHFSVSGFPKNTKGKFFVTKIQTILSVYYSKYNKTYRPVFKVGENGTWKRLQTQAQLVMRENSELQCVFQYQFRNEEETVFFAFAYPFTYTEHLRYLHSLNDFLFCEEFYFHKEILTYSPEERQIHLLTITSYDHQDKLNENQELFNEQLFPERARPLRFKKPVILISGRVHPGQTAASFAMKGVIDFLTSKVDARAYLLRKMFVFMIVPMINVDGVYHGHFRMDIQGKNLNRFYINPCPIKQPAIYAIKELANHLTKQSRLSFYFDLHAHNAKKGCFIYGNAINDFVEQVESQVFCKLVSLNNKNFQYEYCNFSQKHMKAKDRNEDLTKEGCGRVVMHRLAKIIHSYSVQCGIVSVNKLNELPDPPNQEFELGKNTFCKDPLEDNQNPVYKGSQTPLYTPGMYQNLGKNLMVSILDVFDKNPYNRVYNSKYKSMDMLRRLTAFQIFHEAERFRMFERFIFGKVKNINELIKEVLNTKLHYVKLYNFYFYDDKELKHLCWPSNIPGLCKPKVESPTKSNKGRRSSYNNEYAEEFFKALKQNTCEIDASNSNGKSKKEEFEEEKKEMELEDSQKSSETSDYSPQKRIPSLEEEMFLNEQEQQKGGSKRMEEKIDKQILSEENISLRLRAASNDQQERKKQNPGVRVRRLLKQELISATFKSDRDIVVIKKPFEEEPVVKGSEIKQNVYREIKEEIKLSLRKDEDRSSKRSSKTSEIISTSNMKRQKERIKSWGKKSYKTDRTKVQLPALGSQMYIISTSTSNFLKKS